MALVVAGERSGVGKTTVTLALLAALRQRGQSVQSYKVGPDYIDPMFHRHVTGQPCYNLDPVLTSAAYVGQCYRQHRAQGDYALVEGVMGLYDGGPGGGGSTAHVARLIGQPILLVVDCSRLGQSVAAIVQGYRSLDPRVKLAGVVLNRVGSDRHLDILREALKRLGVPVLGVLRRQDSITIPDRHLGLVPTAELPGLEALVGELAHLGEHCFDWQQLDPLLRHDLPIKPQAQAHPISAAPPGPPVRIALACDRAFSFYYPDNLDALEAAGAVLVPWSPLTDQTLPPDIQGLYLGGGFPEMFAEVLADNQDGRAAIAAQIRAGLPTYAECGGLMYLCQELIDLQGQHWPMVGILPAITQMGARLTLGYCQATVQQDGPLLKAKSKVVGHEFHRSQLTFGPSSPLYALRKLRDATPHPEGWHPYQVHASYLHLHWGHRPALPQRFVAACRHFQLSLPDFLPV